MKCTIVPAERLYHPVLPFRANQKVMFGLCRTCVLTSNTGECHLNTDEEMALTGTRVIDEVRLAVQKGYRILEIHEMYEYNVTRYDHETLDDGLFVGYIDNFIKLKAEASGCPAWVRTPSDEELYLDSFWKSEGIRLDREAIKPNIVKRALAKLCHNSMSGKLTERNDRTRNKIITEPHELYRFLATLGLEVTNLVFASDDVVWLSWKVTT